MAGQAGREDWESNPTRPGEFCTVLNHVGQWRDVPTRIPLGDAWYTQSESNLDVVICSLSAMEALPEVQAIGSGSALDTRGYGMCPTRPTPLCPHECECELTPMSDHQLITVAVQGTVSKTKVSRPDKWVWNLRKIEQDPDLQDEFMAALETRGTMACLAEKATPS